MAKKPTASVKVALKDFSEPIHENTRNMKTLGRESKMANTQAVSRAEQGLARVLDYGTRLFFVSRNWDYSLL